MLKTGSRVHFVGIGGIGMSALANLLLGLGHAVSGSDLKASPITDALVRRGAAVAAGSHSPEHTAGADLVVVSAAVDSGNPEVEAARRLGIPVLGRGQLLALLMESRQGIAVAGSHGKTTTTAMLSLVMADAGLDPTCVVGGWVRQLGGNWRLGAGSHLVAEADESDRSFLALRPSAAIITNIDREHMSAYRGETDLLDAFAAFADSVADGPCAVCGEDPGIQRMASRLRRPPVTFGLGGGADWAADVQEAGFWGSRFLVRRHGAAWGQVRLRVPGVHNVRNALGAAAVCHWLGLQAEACVQALGRFEGVGRRMENKGLAGGVLFMDDYAHHPTEVHATLKAARGSGRRLVVLFQPHRFTRTRDCLEELSAALQSADVLLVTDIYAAGEERLQGVSAPRLVEETVRAGHRGAGYVPRDQAVAQACSRLAPGDLFISMGAGDVDCMGAEILRRWKGIHGHRS